MRLAYLWVVRLGGEKETDEFEITIWLCENSTQSQTCRFNQVRSFYDWWLGCYYFICDV
jgi:hypothetical protein